MTTSELIVCPDCRHENIPGTDTCDECGQSLSPLSKPVPGSLLERQIIEDRIAALKPRDALTVAPNASVGDVLKLLVDNAIGCALVVDGDAVAGIFTERDALLKLSAEAASLSDRPVSDFMTAGPDGLASKDRIAYALHKMDLGGYRHVPVLDAGLPPKIISIRDILRYLTERITGG